MIDISIGSTARLGKSKTSTLWEVIKVEAGTGMVSLSKLGGDGYVNKYAHVDELRDVGERLLEVTLADCLALQTSVQNWGRTITDRARFFSNSGEVHDTVAKVADTSKRWHQAVQDYEAGVAQHYPHIVKKEK
ncbi:hypothetical protein [Glutamicibacter sp. TV12E]|uniref:hypothetical protein n=1 Tax=Glutamicibacter sp. TV12E TaxID=3446362 RepID=UPI0040335644